jgi:hypothetical protein
MGAGIQAESRDVIMLGKRFVFSFFLSFFFLMKLRLALNSQSS